MFHSFTTSSSLSAGSRQHPLFHPTATIAAPPRGQLLSDANGFVGPLPSSSAPYASSLPSEYFLPRSSSAHSLLLHHHHHHHHNHHIPDSTNAPQPPPPPYSPSRSSSSCDYLDFNASPMRRVLSAGDIQVTQRVGRYSTEERKERIERYRSKRNHRNFHKKITYACRKTLADSRPRTRGRFARNGENETAAAAAAGASGVECFGYDNHEQNQGFDVVDDGNGGGDWRSQLQAALAAEVDEPGSCYDEDLLASFADVISMNILS